MRDRTEPGTARSVDTSAVNRGSRGGVKQACAGAVGVAGTHWGLVVGNLSARLVLTERSCVIPSVAEGPRIFYDASNVDSPTARGAELPIFLTSFRTQIIPRWIHRFDQFDFLRSRPILQLLFA